MPCAICTWGGGEEKGQSTSMKSITGSWRPAYISPVYGSIELIPIPVKENEEEWLRIKLSGLSKPLPFWFKRNYVFWLNLNMSFHKQSISTVLHSCSEPKPRFYLTSKCHVLDKDSYANRSCPHWVLWAVKCLAGKSLLHVLLCCSWLLLSSMLSFPVLWDCCYYRAAALAKQIEHETGSAEPG